LVGGKWLGAGGMFLKFPPGGAPLGGLDGGGFDGGWIMLSI